MPLLLRLGLLAIVLTVLAVRFEAPAVGAALPALGAWLDVIDATYQTRSLGLVSLNGEQMVQRIATPRQAHVVGTRVVSADPRTAFTASAAAGLVLQPLVLGLALLAVLPWRGGIVLMQRLCVALPLLCVVCLLDVPLILYASTWSAELERFDPAGFSPLVYWAAFMVMGGRYALTVAAIAVTAGLTSRRRPVPSDDPAAQSPLVNRG